MGHLPACADESSRKLKVMAFHFVSFCVLLCRNVDREVEIGIPSEPSRHDILVKLLARFPNTLSDADVRHCASVTHGYVGADLLAVCKEAAQAALKRCITAGVAGTHWGEGMSRRNDGDENSIHLLVV